MRRCLASTESLRTRSTARRCAGPRSHPPCRRRRAGSPPPSSGHGPSEGRASRRRRSATPSRSSLTLKRRGCRQRISERNCSSERSGAVRAEAMRNNLQLERPALVSTDHDVAEGRHVEVHRVEVDIGISRPLLIGAASRTKAPGRRPSRPSESTGASSALPTPSTRGRHTALAAEPETHLQRESQRGRKRIEKRSHRLSTQACASASVPKMAMMSRSSLSML